MPEFDPRWPTPDPVLIEDGKPFDVLVDIEPEKWLPLVPEPAANGGWTYRLDGEPSAVVVPTPPKIAGERPTLFEIRFADGRPPVEAWLIYPGMFGGP